MLDPSFCNDLVTMDLSAAQTYALLNQQSWPDRVRFLRISRLENTWDSNQPFGVPGIVRNRLKVRAATQKALAFLRVRDEVGSFDRYPWHWVDGEPLRDPAGRTPGTLPASTPLSKDLRKRGFTFVVTTIDHTVNCFRCHAAGSLDRRKHGGVVLRADSGGAFTRLLLSQPTRRATRRMTDELATDCPQCLSVDLCVASAYEFCTRDIVDETE